jgi:hypothetical protein
MVQQEEFVLARLVWRLMVHASVSSLSGPSSPDAGEGYCACSADRSAFHQRPTDMLVYPCRSNDICFAHDACCHACVSISLLVPSVSSTAKRAAATPATGSLRDVPSGICTFSGSSPAWSSAPAWSHMMCSAEACVQHGDVYHGRLRTVRKPIAADVDDGDHRDRERLPRRRHARQKPVDGGVVRHVEDELIHDAIGADRPRNELKPGVARVAARRHIRKRGIPPRRRLGTPKDKVVSIERSQVFSTNSSRHLR